MPPAPDYSQAAKDTASGNLDYARYSTQANRPTEITPFGTRSWTQGGGAKTFNQSGYDAANAAYMKGLAAPAGGGQAGMQGTDANGTPYYTGGGTPGGTPTGAGTPPKMDDYWNTNGSPDQWTSNINLTPEMQSLLDQQTRISQGLGNEAEAGISRVHDATSQPFDFSSGADLQGKAEAALMSRLIPYQQRQRDAEGQTLANQGIRIGSEAYGTAQTQRGQQENDARQQAVLGAYSLTPQMLAQALAIRNQPLNELNALRSGSQVSMPTFGPTGQQGTVAGPNLLGAVGQQAQYNQGVYNADQAASGQQTQGLMSIGAMAATMF